MRRYIFCILLVLALSLPAAPGFSRPPEDFKNRPPKERIEKTWKRIETLKMWRLTQRLDLDEETASRLFPVINRYDKQRLALQRGIRRDMRELRRSVETAGEDKLRRIMKRLRERRMKLQEIDAEETEKLAGILSTRELAKFIIFRQDFDR
ncbi:MAG: hypothetical protein GXP46_10290, partial [Deferribacteres bacterium]|nr:hypothetical protein [Deferribacteres bacterium]